MKVKKKAINYRKRLNELIARCRRAGIKVRFVSSGELKDYGAMNDEAAKPIGFRRLPDDTVLIDRNMRTKIQYECVEHEVEEMIDMEYKHKDYWHAHLIALNAEVHGFTPFVRKKLNKGMK